MSCTQLDGTTRDEKNDAQLVGPSTPERWAVGATGYVPGTRAMDVVSDTGWVHPVGIVSFRISSG